MSKFSLLVNVLNCSEILAAHIGLVGGAGSNLVVSIYHK